MAVYRIYPGCFYAVFTKQEEQLFLTRGERTFDEAKKKNHELLWFQSLLSF